MSERAAESDSGSEEEEEAPKGRADAPTRWAKSFGTVTHDPLADTDGVATRLYYYLWRKNAAGRTPTEFRIPDTVVYKYRLPAFWFFSSKQNGQIMKKKQLNVAASKIIESFTKKKSCAAPDAPCAVHIYTDSAERQARLRGARPVAGAAAARASPLGEDDDADGAAVTVVEFLDAPALEKFMLHGDKQQDAVLQRFLAPRGTSQSVIRAAWTPAVCLLERRTNRHALDERHVGLAARCVTFEGSDADSVSEPLNSTALAERVRRAAGALVAHVAAVSGGAAVVSRAVFHFALGADEALYFLHATALRLRPGGQPVPRAPPAASRASSSGSAGARLSAAPRASAATPADAARRSAAAAAALARLALRPPSLPAAMVRQPVLTHALDLDPVFSTNPSALARQEERRARPAPRDSVAAAAAAAQAQLPRRRTQAELRAGNAAFDESAAAAEARRRAVLAQAQARRGEPKPLQPPFRGGVLPLPEPKPVAGAAQQAPPAPAPPRRPDAAALAALAVPPKRAPPPPPSGFDTRPGAAQGARRSADAPLQPTGAAARTPALRATYGAAPPRPKPAAPRAAPKTAAALAPAQRKPNNRAAEAAAIAAAVAQARAAQAAGHLDGVMGAGAAAADEAPGAEDE